MYARDSIDVIFFNVLISTVNWGAQKHLKIIVGAPGFNC